LCVNVLRRRENRLGYCNKIKDIPFYARRYTRTDKAFPRGAIFYEDRHYLDCSCAT